MGNLSRKQRQFVNEYVVDRNATQAAIRAGYAEGSAHVAASRLLSNDKIKALVDEKMIELGERTMRTAQDAIEDIVRLARIAESNGDVKTAIRGFELEAKSKGGFIERKAEVNTDGEDVDRTITVEFVGKGD